MCVIIYELPQSSCNLSPMMVFDLPKHVEVLIEGDFLCPCKVRHKRATVCLSKPFYQIVMDYRLSEDTGGCYMRSHSSVSINAVLITWCYMRCFVFCLAL